MKRIISILAVVIITAGVFAQAPQKMSYQAVIRNGSDQLVTNTQVGMQISILQGSATGTAVYVETQTPTTNDNGLVSFEIGGGAGFSTIDWAIDTYFIKTETDLNGGSSYTITGTSQLLSVPYALHSKTAEGIIGGITETDPVFAASPASGILLDNISNWNTAYGWGNHASAGYLTSFTEADPVFGAHAASGITSGLMGNWNTAYGWGNHASAGYLTSFTEADPVFGAHAANGITPGLMGNWNTAYSWGNHSSAGYLTSFTEADPVFGAHAASGITSGLMGNWNTAYGWGNHANAGYLTSFTEADPVFGAHAANGITSGLMGNWNTAYGWGNHASAGYLTSFTEADPVFGAHAASGITSGLMGNWNTAYGWGNHVNAGYLTSFTEADPVFGAHAASGITSGLMGNWNTAYGWGNHASAGYLTSFTEADPVFGAHAANGITSGLIGNWNTAYSWGNHASAGYLTSFTEADPVFGAHAANGITSGLIGNWNTSFGWGDHASAGYLTTFTELDPEVGSNSTNYLSKWDGTSLVSSSIFDNGNVGIGTTNPNSRLDLGTGYGIDGEKFLIYNDDFSGSLAGTKMGFYIDRFSLQNNCTFAFTTTAAYPGSFIFAAKDYSGTTLNPLMTVLGENGNVGIGTTNPTTRLDVIGVITATGGNSASWNTAYGWGDHAAAGYLISEVDGSVTNEIQTLSLSNDTVYLTNGGFVKIPEQKSVPALITYDDFSGTNLKSFWTCTTTGGAGYGFNWNSYSAISLSTAGANSIKLRSNKQKSVTEGKLIFKALTYTYEDNNTAYGPLVRGLVNGTDRNNAIEFINISGNTIQARTVSGGVATTTNYAVGASVGNLYTYTIIASNKKVEFYFDGTLIATHTTNIPTLPLNMYFDASTWTGNVPQCIDDARFEIIRN